MPDRTPLHEIFDDLPDLVYVSDIDTHELLFLNKAGRQIFNIEGDISGKTCYEVLRGRTSPCSFCTNQKLSIDSVFEWEYTNPVVNRHYLLKDKLISWHDGRIVRLEIAIDITEQTKRQAELEKLLTVERFIIDCTKLLYRPVPIQNNIQDMLALVGTFLHGDRTFIFDIEDDVVNNTYEWCAAGIQPQKDVLQNVNISLIERWIPIFRADQCVNIEDIEAIKLFNEQEYELLHMQGIRSLMAMPLLTEESQLLGFMGVDNPGNTINTQSVELIFKTLSHFIVSLFIRQQFEYLLKEQSYTDQLTGLQNRNKFISDIRHFDKSEQGSMGIAYVDMNGLKALNDNYGHERGDKAIQQIALCLKNHFRKNNIYRIGGDEFVVICPRIPRELFETKVGQLKGQASRNGCPSFSVGHQWLASIVNLQTHLHETDLIMYNNKKKYYKDQNLEQRRAEA